MNDLTQGNVFKHILKFSVPMLLGNVFQQFYNVVDSLIVGNFLGNSSLAAVGASFPVIFVLVSLIMGLTMGMSVVISQYYGAKNYIGVKKAIDSMMIFVLIAGVIIGVFGAIFSETIFTLLNFPEDVIAEAGIYFKIFIAGIIFNFGYNGVSAVLRGLGDSKTPLYFLIISTVLNVLLDLFFVLVLKMGIAGVAWATVISQAVSFIGLTLWLNKTHLFIKIKFLLLKFDLEIFMKSIKIGLPSGIQHTIVGLSMTALTTIVGAFGTATIAGFSVAIRLDSFAMMPALNISIALTSFVGQNVGAGKFNRIREAYHSGLILSSILSVLTGLIFIIWGRNLVGFFTPDTEVQLVGAQYLRTMGGFYFVLSAMFMTNGVLRGAGDTLVPMFITLFALWAVRIPVAYILSREWSGLGSNGIWWGSPVSWIVGFILSYLYYIKGNWIKKSIIKSV